MSKNQNKWLATFMLAGMILVVSFWLANRGYGEVSPQTYEYSKAIYGACLNKNEVHLEKVEELLASDKAVVIPDKERNWLEAIVTKARDGNWEKAAKKARRMMEDQVQY